MSTGEHHERGLSEGTEIAKKALSKRAWYVQGGAHLESGVHMLGGGDSKEGWQDRLGCQEFWTSGKVVVGVILARGCRCVPQGASWKGKSGGREERGGKWGCFPWPPEALESLKKQSGQP